MRSKTMAAMIAFACLAACLEAFEGEPYDVDLLVPLSDLVILGEVTGSAEGTATVRATEFLKGRAADEISITGIREWKAPLKRLPEGAKYLLFLTRTGEGYRIVGTDRFLEGCAGPDTAAKARVRIAAESWGEEKDGLRLSAFCMEPRTTSGGSCWLHLQAWNVTEKEVVVRAAPASLEGGSTLSLEDPDGKSRMVGRRTDSPAELKIPPHEIRSWTLDPNEPLFQLDRPGTWKIVWHLGEARSLAVTVETVAADTPPKRPSPEVLDMKARLDALKAKRAATAGREAEALDAEIRKLEDALHELERKAD